MSTTVHLLGILQLKKNRLIFPPACLRYDFNDISFKLPLPERKSRFLVFDGQSVWTGSES